MGDVVVVDGQVNREKLSELLAIGAEHEELDYKRTLDLSSGPSKANVDFIKDCLAMASLPNGGYLVVGVDDHGAPAINQRRIDASHFDSKALADKVAGYIEDHLEIVSAVHKVPTAGGDWEIAVVYVPPSRSGFPLVASRGGRYRIESRELTVFRRGDVIVREGTGSTPLAQRHWPRLLQNYTERVRDETRADMDTLVQALTDSLHAQSKLTDSVIPPLMEMDGANFASALRSASRPQIREALRQASSLALNASLAEAAAPLDKIALAGIIAVEARRPKLLRAVVAAFWTVYEAAPRPSVHPVRLNAPADVLTATMWRDILTRVTGIGSFAVRTDQWWALGVLALVPFEESEGYSYPSWLRHGLVYASRAHVLIEKPDEPSGLMLSRARQYLTQHPQARPDVPVFRDGSLEGLPPTQSDRLLNSICQFDYLWNVMAGLEGPDDPSLAFYTSWAAFDFSRTRPIMDRLLREPALRRAVAPTATDEQLAAAMKTVQSMALQETVRLRGTR